LVKDYITKKCDISLHSNFAVIRKGIEMKHIAMNLEAIPAAVDMDDDPLTKYFEGVQASPALEVEHQVNTVSQPLNNFDTWFEDETPVIKKGVKAKERKQIEIQKFITIAENLSTEYKIIDKELLTRGTNSLYAWLASVHKLINSIDESKHKKFIIAKMRFNIQSRTVNGNKGKKPSAKTPIESLVIKHSLFGASRQTIHNYSRTLKVARADNIAPSNLASYIHAEGGITKIKSSKVEIQKSKINREIVAEREDLIRRFYIVKGAQSDDIFEYDKCTFQWPVNIPNDKNIFDIDSSTHTGSFAIFLTYYDYNIDKYRIINANDFGATFENTILNHISARANIDNHDLKVFVQNEEIKLWGKSKEQRLEERELQKEKNLLEIAKKQVDLLENKELEIVQNMEKYLQPVGEKNEFESV